ncbi:hypothetical protein BHE74_00051778 [Ensete ventricosum]|nr:hypothetical protein BHE74_00051778 [Ensete ventricosum]
MRAGRYQVVPSKGSRRRSIEGKIDRRRSIEEKSRREEEEKEAKKKEEAKKKRYLEPSSPVRRRHPWITHESSTHGRFFSPCGAKRSRRHRLL